MLHIDHRMSHHLFRPWKKTLIILFVILEKLALTKCSRSPGWEMLLPVLKVFLFITQRNPMMGPTSLTSWNTHKFPFMMDLCQCKGTTGLNKGWPVSHMAGWCIREAFGSPETSTKRSIPALQQCLCLQAPDWMSVSVDHLWIFWPVENRGYLFFWKIVSQLYSTR